MDETFRYFESADGLYGVRISSLILKNLHDLCSESYPYETGGILIGRYSEDLTWAIITSITNAPMASRHTPCLFVRSNQGVLAQLKGLWKWDQYYLGEWHYHPNASPKPSGLDSKTMFNLSKNKSLHCPEPILFIVGGNPRDWQQYLSVFKQNKEIELHEVLEIERSNL